MRFDMNVDLKKLLARLNPLCKKALESAAGLCVNRDHYEVDITHLLVQLLDEDKSDLSVVLKNDDISIDKWKIDLNHEMELLRSGNPGRPVFSNRLIDCIKSAWMFSSVDVGIEEIRTSSILAAICDESMKYGVDVLDGISNISSDSIRKQFWNVVQLSGEGALHDEHLSGDRVHSSQSHNGTYLEKYTVNFTQRARDGLIDPVFGRDNEIRQIIDILARRRKNNPIAVGDAGVGKTAVVEGLALKLVSGDIPDVIKGVDILGLDLGLLQAGASIKGEFENRLNSVITEIKSSIRPIILFIDEAHTLIGAGGAAGTNDAANILKPALARGELRTIAATTWSEYKKYFEKDAALERRFQLVKLEEPSIDNAVVILRGLRPIYERSHGVYIRDEAIIAAANLSARYITGRQLPDKAVDVLDTSCARVKISLKSKPIKIENLERQISVLYRERDAIKRDVSTRCSNDIGRIEHLDAEISSAQSSLDSATNEWKIEQSAVKKVLKLRNNTPELANNESKTNTTNNELILALDDLAKIQSNSANISYEVTSEVVESVVSDWTGIPVNRLVSNQIESIFKLRDSMKLWVRGQDHAIDLIDSALRTAKAGLHNPDQPLGVFLLVGPSGVGKTETALGIANLMYGGERFMTTINMSEYQGKHTVSRLVGSPVGYVGYGEGGVLTEAIRQRPYSLLLLDEVEKADLDVVNIFYQVFDKGILADGEGREIDFKNTVIILTSNLSTSTIMKLCEGDVIPQLDETIEAIRPELQKHFKPALLGRMTVIPYYPIRQNVLKEIIKNKLDRVATRLLASHKLALLYDECVVDAIAKNCTDIDSGARNVDHIITKSLLPMISNELLQRMGTLSNEMSIKIGVSMNSSFTISFQ